MTLQANELGYGEGDYGGSAFGSGGEAVLSIVSPADGAAGVSPLVDLVFEIAGDMFDFGALHVEVGGVAAVVAGVAQIGFRLVTSLIVGGWRFTVSRLAALPLNTLTSYTVQFYDAGDLVSVTASFTTVGAFSLSTVTVVDKRTLRFTFSREPKDEATLYARENYEIEVRTGIVKKPQVLSVTHTAGTSYVDATLLDYLPTGGDFRATVRRVRDTYLVEITP